MLKLNSVQSRAIKHYKGPLLINAGAGAGKTMIITHRIAYLIKAKNVNPTRILAVTFTNKAAEEMRERVIKLVGKTNLKSKPYVSTFHSFCGRILREDIDKLKKDKNFVIYDQLDQVSIMKSVLQSLNLDDKQYKPKSLLQQISIEKGNMVTVEEYEKKAEDFYQKTVAQAYKEYQKLLDQNNAIDFDDMLVMAVLLLKNNPAVLKKWQDRYDYLLVDEYQDTNYVQYLLMSYLAKKHKNICVVGDCDQNIYTWRGATIKNILDFEKDYRNAHIITLEQNYRSTQSILQLANGIIKHNLSRKVKNLWTENTKGESALHYIAYDEHDEAGFIADEIEHLCLQENYIANDFVILYRTNAQSRVIEEILMKRGIKYRIVGGIRFYERKEVKDILAYLRVILNPHDNQSLSRVLNSPSRGIGKITLNKLAAKSEKIGKPIYDLLLDKKILSSKCLRITQKFINTIDDLRKNFFNEDPSQPPKMSISELIEKVIKDTGYEQMLKEDKSKDGLDRLENIKELISSAEDRESSLGEYLNNISLMTDLDAIDQSGEAITLMTLHSAKGLEFSVVFMAGVEEGLLPHYRAQFDDEAVEEERRLCYVGITRAQKKIYFTSCNQRSIFGDMWFNETSRFLKEAPKTLLATFVNERLVENNDSAVVKLREENIPFDVRSIKSIKDKKDEKKEKEYNYHKGDKIYHDTWGKGIVIQVFGKDESQTVKARFGKLEKLLMVKYAPIKKGWQKPPPEKEEKVDKKKEFFKKKNFHQAPTKKVFTHKKYK